MALAQEMTSSGKTATIGVEAEARADIDRRLAAIEAEEGGCLPSALARPRRLASLRLRTAQFFGHVTYDSQD